MCCLFVCLFICLWVCYHDNSKLRASILTKLGLWVKVVTISSWLNFGRPTTPGRGLRRGEIFGCALFKKSARMRRKHCALATASRSVCVSSERFFKFLKWFWFLTNSNNRKSLVEHVRQIVCTATRPCCLLCQSKDSSALAARLRPHVATVRRVLWKTAADQSTDRTLTSSVTTWCVVLKCNNFINMFRFWFKSFWGDYDINHLTLAVFWSHLQISFWHTICYLDLNE